MKKICLKVRGVYEKILNRSRNLYNKSFSIHGCCSEEQYEWKKVEKAGEKVGFFQFVITRVQSNITAKI